MGTTLTGTTPQDTYDSLIKVTDNGPLSGTLKALSDGLGNDSTLSLSTTAASIAGTLSVSGNATFDTSTLFVDAAANEVGIGTITPSAKLDVDGTSYVIVANNSIGNRKLKFGIDSVAGEPTIQAALTNDTARLLLINPEGGNVGIGTSAPTTLGAGITSLDVAGTAGGGLTTRGTTVTGELIALDAAAGFYISTKTNHPIVLRTNDVERVRITNNGLTFNGDTAAANALDDYEEGTWTMGVSFGEASVGVTTSTNTGSYTKIGRQVTVNGYLELSSKGSSSGAARITGLPFTIGNSTSNFSAPTLRLANIAFVNQFQGYGEYNATSIRLQETTILGVVTDLTEVEFANNSGIIFCFTYFV